jgi:hypothetical protein
LATPQENGADHIGIASVSQWADTGITPEGKALTPLWDEGFIVIAVR